MDAARDKFKAALRAAYDAGATYQQIGDLLGLSRQRIAQLITD
jgi:DNA-binding transcriptional regulator LsrR (DeoR family)